MRRFNTPLRPTAIFASFAISMATLTTGVAPVHAAPAAATIAPEPSDETDEAKADRLLSEGAAAFEAGELEDAIFLFVQSYELDPKPNLIFNIGRVHEELGNLESAAEFYDKFVVLPGVDLESRRFAVERLEVVRQVLERSKPKPVETPEDTESSDSKAEIIIESDTLPPIVQPESFAPEPEKKPPLIRGLRIGGAVTAGMGVAALIAGAVLGDICAKRVAAADAEPLVPLANELRLSARPYALAADSLFIAGGVLAAAGVTMVGVSFSKRLDRRHAFVPTFDRRHVAFAYVRRF